VHIFLDESGSFATPPQPKLRVAAVGALVLPDGELESAFREFQRLLRQFGASEDGT
jgi:hypothetical protein